MTVALVTGCDTGIGHATARRLALDGHDVIATVLDPSSRRLASSGVDVRALDVTDQEAITRVFAEVIAERGGIDILVNNAGIATGGVVEEAPIETFRHVVETNFFGALACMKAVLPSMRERGRGWIVNVSSQGGVFAMPGMGPYCASKWALEAVSESLAIEVAPFGIRVIVIEPGAIRTPIWRKVDTTPPAGPYAAIRNRLAAAVMADVARASRVDEVVACISEAISTDSPKLRWLVGQGAERNVRIAASIPTEERIALWNDPNEAEFMRRMIPSEAAPLPVRAETSRGRSLAS